MKVSIWTDDNGRPMIELSATARTYACDPMEELVQWAHALWTWVQQDVHAEPAEQQ